MEQAIFRVEIAVSEDVQCVKYIKIVMSGVPVAPHGLIFGEDEATASRKLFKHLPGPPGLVFGPKTPQK